MWAAHEHDMYLFAITWIERLQEWHQSPCLNCLLNGLGTHSSYAQTLNRQLALSIAIVGFYAAFDLKGIFISVFDKRPAWSGALEIEVDANRGRTGLQVLQVFPALPNNQVTRR